MAPGRNRTTPFHWSWAIPLISVFLSMADFAYLYALRDPEAMISVVSMIRRGSVVVSFLCGALLFRERNLRSKAVDLAFILVGMIFLWLGSRPKRPVLGAMEWHLASCPILRFQRKTKKDGPVKVRLFYLKHHSI